jgi:hypothetical protein
MDKKRTIDDVQKDIDKLHKKTMDKKQELLSKKEAIEFKIQILNKIYQEEKDRLEREQITITENEVRKELGL